MAEVGRAAILAGRERLIRALEPVLAVVSEVRPAGPGAAERLTEALPLGSETLRHIASIVREGVSEGWLCEKEANGVRFCRVAAADHPGTAPLAVHAVHMDGPGPGHIHPQGEVDLCFAVSGQPTFDGNEPGWVVYPEGSWHVPTVEGGSMDILYFLRDDAIRFGPKPG